MGEKYLVAVDGSDQARKAEDLATRLAEPSETELILLFTVPDQPVPEGFERWAEIEGVSGFDLKARYRANVGEQVVKEAEQRVLGRGLRNVRTVIAEGAAAVEIVKYAKSNAVDVIFMGSRGLGDIEGLVVGSVSHQVLNMSACTCVIAK